MFWKSSSLHAVILGVLLALASTSVASAQDSPRKRAKLQIDVGVLQGKVRKPQVQYIINREKGINQEAITLKESFVDKVVDAVKETPF